MIPLVDNFFSSSMVPNLVTLNLLKLWVAIVLLIPLPMGSWATLDWSSGRHCLGVRVRVVKACIGVLDPFFSLSNLIHSILSELLVSLMDDSTILLLPLPQYSQWGYLSCSGFNLSYTIIPFIFGSAFFDI